MKKLLLDTNVFIWLTQDPAQLGPKARRLLETSELFISPLSILELRIKISIGKYMYEDDIYEMITDHDITILDYTVKSALSYQLFDPNNRDPFDNALLAEAKIHKLTFITSDKNILTLDDGGLRVVSSHV